jgi:hypothetical protein
MVTLVKLENVKDVGLGATTIALVIQKMKDSDGEH